MNSIDRQDFLKYVKSREGERFRSLNGDKLFTVRATKTGVRYTPMSLKKPRSKQTVLAHEPDCFEDMESLSTNDFWDFTYCFSYTLSLIRGYLAHRDMTEAS